jgi:gamma-glutamyltranspeptidase / glutathione hydrolase
MFTPAPELSKDRDNDDARVNGIYRAGSDHRKDGEAVGW